MTTPTPDLVQAADPSQHVCREHTEPAHTHPGVYDSPTGTYEIPDDGLVWGYVDEATAAEANALLDAMGYPPDGVCYCAGCIGMGPCDDDLGRIEDRDDDEVYDEDGDSS